MSPQYSGRWIRYLGHCRTADFRLYHPAAFPRRFSQAFPFQYTRIIADSGYESEKLHEARRTGYDAYIKPSDHELTEKRRFKKDIRQIQNIWTMMRKMMSFIATITVS